MADSGNTQTSYAKAIRLWVERYGDAMKQVREHVRQVEHLKTQMHAALDRAEHRSECPRAVAFGGTPSAACTCLRLDLEDLLT